MGVRKRKAVKFHRDVYPESAVKAAAAEYAGYADIRISRSGDYLLAVITPEDGSASDVLAEEFANRAFFNSL